MSQKARQCWFYAKFQRIFIPMDALRRCRLLHQLAVAAQVGQIDEM